MKTKFLAFTDLHTDIVHDTVARVQESTEKRKDSWSFCDRDGEEVQIKK